MEIKKMENKIMLLSNGEIEKYAMNSYMNGVKDGIGFAVGGYILYRIGRFLVKGYIDYKVEESNKRGTAN